MPLGVEKARRKENKMVDFAVGFTAIQDSIKCKSSRKKAPT